MPLNPDKIYKTVYRFDVLIPIRTGRTELLLGVNAETGDLIQFSYGDPIEPPRAVAPHGEVRRGEELPSVYAAYGSTELVAALRVVHADGGLSTELVYATHETVLEPMGTTLTVIWLRDQRYLGSGYQKSDHMVDHGGNGFGEKDEIERQLAFYASRYHTTIANLANQIGYVSPDGSLQLTVGQLINIGITMSKEQFNAMINQDVTPRDTCVSLGESSVSGIVTAKDMLDYLNKTVQQSNILYTEKCIDGFYTGQSIVSGGDVLPENLSKDNVSPLPLEGPLRKSRYTEEQTSSP